LLPEGVTNLWVTFTEVLAHRSGGGGWESLPMPRTPYTLDLLQFWGGNTTELVPPVMLVSGKYTQIRLVIAEVDGAFIRFDNDNQKKYPVVIPSENLKTDKNFDFDVETGRAASILIDFDLSQSLVVTYDGLGTPSYKLKPVLHIVSASEAATINGEIPNESFVDDKNAIVTVFYNNIDPESPPGEDNYEEYTKVVVLNPNSSPSPPSSPTPSQPSSPTPSQPSTTFTIYWIVPNSGYEPPRGDYRVEIDLNDEDYSCDFYDEEIFLDKGDDYTFVHHACPM